MSRHFIAAEATDMLSCGQVGSYTGETYRPVTDSPADTGFFATGQNADILVSGIDFDNTGGGQPFNHPAGIATDGTKVAITDTFNNRVLIWNTPPASNVAPNVALGQANFTTNNPGTGRNQMNWPVSVSMGGGKLFVSDAYNNRILIWNSIRSPSSQAAGPWTVEPRSARVSMRSMSGRSQ